MMNCCAVWRSFAVAMMLAAAGCGGSDDPQPVASTDLRPESSSASPGEAEPDTPPEGEDPMPAVVARVAGVDITREELRAELLTKQRQLDAELSVLRETSRQDIKPQRMSALSKQETLENLAAKVLLRKLAADAGVEASAAEIDERVAEGRASLTDDEKYQEYLDWYELTEALLREQIRDQILTEKYLAQELEPCAITEAELRDAYDELLAANKLEGPEEADFSHVLLMVPPGADESVWDAREAELTAIRDRIVGGEDLGAVAREESEDPSAPRNDGRYEFIPREMMVPAVDAWLFSGPVGELSEPIQTSYGWHIVRVEARREGGVRSFEAIDERLRESLEKNCQARMAKEFVEAKMLQHNAEFLYTVPGSDVQRASLAEEASAEASPAADAEPAEEDSP